MLAYSCGSWPMQDPGRQSVKERRSEGEGVTENFIAIESKKKSLLLRFPAARYSLPAHSRDACVQRERGDEGVSLKRSWSYFSGERLGIITLVFTSKKKKKRLMG